MRTKARLLTAALLVGATVGCIAGRPALERDSEEARELEEEMTEAKRSWSGISYADRTTVERTPRASEAADGFDAERVWGGSDDWEPAVGVDPNGTYVYQMTTRYGGTPACPNCADPALIFRRSSDGGATWDADQYLYTSAGTQNDPEIEVASDGSLYAVFMHNYLPGIKFTRSRDRGQTWTRPIPVVAGGRPRWSDKPILAISRDGRDVYVGFNASSAYVATSHDSGDSFLAPVKTSNDARYWFHSAGAVGSNGNAFFGAADYSQDYTGDVNISVISSSDRGATWKTTRIDASRAVPACPWSPGCYYGFFGPSIALAVDASGLVMVAYTSSDVDGAPQRLFVRTSRDGVTWSPRQELGESEVAHGFPALAAGPTAGDFRLAWQDDRDQSNSGWNTWLRQTTDGGVTWGADTKLSDLSTGAPYKSANGYNFPYGDYFEIGVDNAGMNHIIWGEGSNYNGPGGTWYTRGQ